MEIAKPYNIVLEQGEANKPYYELSEGERKEIGLEIFREVTRLYEKFGLKPVTSQTLQVEAGSASKSSK